MKATLKQIENTINRTETELSNHVQGGVLFAEDKAVNQVCNEVRKSRIHFNKSDNEKLYKVIQDMIKDY